MDLISEVSQQIYITVTYCSATEIQQFNYILIYFKIIMHVIILILFNV